MGPGTERGANRTADAATTNKGDGPEATTAGLEGSINGAIQRRAFLGRIAGLVLAGTMAQQASAQEPSSAPAAGTQPGIDTPMAIGRYTADHGFLFDGTRRISAQTASVGDFPRTAAGGVLYAVALDLERIGRDKIPAGHGIQISVVSNRLDPQTGELLTVNFVIDPKNVPASLAVNSETYRTAMLNDRGLRDFVNALSQINDQARLGVGVRVSRSPNVQFEFMTQDPDTRKLTRPATMTMQAVPLEKK